MTRESEWSTLGRTAVLTCMELTPIPDGLAYADAAVDVVQNGGGVATSDAIHALRMSQAVNGTTSVIVVLHTCCEFLPVTEQFHRLQLNAAFPELDLWQPGDVARVSAAVIDVLRRPGVLAQTTSFRTAVWDERDRRYVRLD